MAQISSASTQEDIVGEYLNTCGYDVDGDASACRRFIAACRALLVMHPANWSQSSSAITFDPKLWAQQLDSALNWLRANQTDQSGSVKHLSFGGDFR